MERKGYDPESGQPGLTEAELYVACETMGICKEDELPKNSKDSKKPLPDQMVCLTNFFQNPTLYVFTEGALLPEVQATGLHDWDGSQDGCGQRGAWQNQRDQWGDAITISRVLQAFSVQGLQHRHQPHRHGNLHPVVHPGLCFCSEGEREGPEGATTVEAFQTGLAACPLH